MMNLRFSNLRQICLNGTSLAVVCGFAMVGASAAASADPMPATTASPFLSGVQSAINNVSLQSFLDADAPLTMYGVTVYGTVDVGISNQTHGADYNADFPTAVNELMSNNSNNSKTYLTPNGMEQSKFGIKGSEELYDGINLVFKFEDGFNPVSGNIANAQRALVDNQGIPKTSGSTNVDSGRAGQWDQGAGFAGLNNSTYGTLTFGRHPTPLFDNVAAYDPLENAYAFSPIGYSGKVSGGGNTEDTRLNRSLKYNVKYGPVRFGALYQLPGNTVNSGGDDAEQVDLGFDYSRLSMDAVYAIKHDAVNIGNLTSATTLSGTISDTYTYALFAKYDLKPVKLMGAYEHITYLNPNNASSINYSNIGDTIGGYAYTAISKASYTTAAIFHVWWAGAQYQITDPLKLEVAYYMYIQDNYSGVDNGVCLSTGSLGGHCAGTEDFASVALDYRFNKRFDVYGGVFYNRINGGLYVNNSYDHNNDLSSMAGVRFKF